MCVCSLNPTGCPVCVFWYNKCVMCNLGLHSVPHTRLIFPQVDLKHIQMKDACQTNEILLFCEGDILPLYPQFSPLPARCIKCLLPALIVCCNTQQCIISDAVDALQGSLNVCFCFLYWKMATEMASSMDEIDTAVQAVAEVLVALSTAYKTTPTHVFSVLELGGYWKLL